MLELVSLLAQSEKCLRPRWNFFLASGDWLLFLLRLLPWLLFEAKSSADIVAVGTVGLRVMWKTGRAALKACPEELESNRD